MVVRVLVCVVVGCAAALAPVRGRARRSVRMTASAIDAASQWTSFVEHQAKGEWFCGRTSYDADGVVADGDEAIAIVTLAPSGGGSTVEHALKVPAAAVASAGCDRCASTIEWRSIPLGAYASGDLGRFLVNGNAAVVGPTLLRSGGCSVEVALADGPLRVALTALYVPVWSDGGGGGPPDALKLRLAVLSREVADGASVFPDADATPDLYRATPAMTWGDGDGDGLLAVDAPGGIAFRVAAAIEPDVPAPVQLRWAPADGATTRGADCVLGALPGPPRLDAFVAT